MKNRICLMAVVGAVIESFLPLYAENKPGLQTPYVWMRTSSLNDNLDNNYAWKDLNGNNVKLDVNGQESVNGRSDIYTYNFYPSLSFTNDANALLRIEGTGLQKATVIGVYGYTSEDDHTEDGFVMNMSNGTDDDETVITKTNVIHTTSSSRKSFGYKDKNLKAAKSNNAEKQKSLRIMSYTKSTNPRQTVASTFNNISIGGQYVDGVTSKVGSFDAETFNDAGKAKRDMSVPELLVYDKALTNEARQKVETYLALKYGITLDVDYTLDEEYGNKGVVWKKDSYSRVCGYGRMDNYNFIQPWTTTSERENPLYLKDTYHKNSFYNKSANENLLVAGRYGMLGDKTLILFADNGSPLEFNKDEEGNLTGTSENAANFEQTEETQVYIPLKRIWKLKNLSPEYSDGEHVAIELPENEGVVEEKFAGSYNIKVNENATATINNMPALVTKGEISWVAGALNGDVTVTLGGQIFKFAASGNISVNGNDVNVRYKAKDLIDVVKKGTTLYVRKNGEIIPSTRVEQTQTPAEWTMEIESKGNAVELNEFHVMSDNVNNDYMELCYGFVETMNQYTNGKIYLLMSDNADFHDENANLRIYRMTSKDRSRHKVLFENLEWKTEDEFTYFTFAVSGDPEEEEEDIKEEPIVNKENPDCQDYSKQGKIMVTLPDDRTYTYTLIGPEGNAIKNSENQLFRGSFEIPNLWAGEYKLYTAPFDGIHKFNLIGKSDNIETVSLIQPFDYVGSMYASWTVGDAKAYSMSGIKYHEQGNDIVYGVRIEGGKIYPVAPDGKNNPSNVAHDIPAGAILIMEGKEKYTENKGICIYVKMKESEESEAVNLFTYENVDNRKHCWAVKTADGKTVKNLSFGYERADQPGQYWNSFTFGGWVPVVENAHTQNFVDSEHLLFQEVDLFSRSIELVCDEEKDNDGNNRSVDNLVVQSSTNGTHKVNLVLTLPSEYKEKEVYIVSPNGSSVPVDVDYVKTEDGSDEFQKQLTIPGNGTYVISVKSGAGDLSKQFIVR